MLNKHNMHPQTKFLAQIVNSARTHTRTHAHTRARTHTHTHTHLIPGPHPQNHCKSFISPSHNHPSFQTSQLHSQQQGWREAGATLYSRRKPLCFVWLIRQKKYVLAPAQTSLPAKRRSSAGVCSPFWLLVRMQARSTPSGFGGTGGAPEVLRRQNKQRGLSHARLCPLNVAMETAIILPKCNAAVISCSEMCWGD